MRILRIQCRYILKTLATGFEKYSPVEHVNLFQSLYTICGKPGTKYIDRTDSLAGEFFQGFVGVWLQPFLPAKTGLKGKLPLGFI